MKPLTKALIGASLLPGFLAAAPSIQFYDAASTGFPTLGVPVGVRAIGMGSAYTAAGNDAYALNWNPAGLAKVTGYQLGLSDNQWAPALGLRQEFLSYGQGLGEGRALGASVNYFGLGTLEQRDSNGALQGKSTAYMLAGTLGYAQAFLAQQRLKLGVALELGGQSLFDATQSEFDASLGALYDWSRELALGVSLDHLGSGSGGLTPPYSLNTGVSYLSFGHRLTLALDGQFQDKALPLLKLGAEMKLSALALRAGYRQALGAVDGDVQSGLTAGAGFQIGVLHLDYAFVTYGTLSNVHRMGVNLDLPSGFFHPKVIAAEGTVEMAKAYFDKAVALEDSGETLQALIEYQRSTESYPEAQRATAQPFYADAKGKVVALQAEMNKRGDNGQVKGLIKEHLAKAQEQLKASRFKDAIAELQQAKKLDPANPAIDKQLTDASTGLEQSLAGYRASARAAEKGGRLDGAVEGYRKVLSLDPADAEALGYLNQHRKALEALLRDIHRKGIYEFVGGRLDAAIQLWSTGESLDYFGDVGFRHDIEKARKRQGQRGGQ